VSRQAGWALTFVALSLALTGCATAAVSPEQRLQARAAYERGLSHMRDRQPSPALTALQEAVSLDGQEALYHNTLGLLLLQLRKPDLALERFREATTLDPDYAEAQLDTGIALAEMGRWEDAIKAYRRAIALPTLSAPHIAHQNMGVALLNLKRYREAEDELRFAISLEPRLESAYYNLGLVFVAEDRKPEARTAFRQARDLAPDSAFGQAALERLKALGDGG
jgi:tetratricopeptide (TPR) repeat protein